MLALDLLTAHLFGDFVFQLGRIPAEKLTNWRIRLLHVTIYTLCFVPAALAATTAPTRIGIFLAALAACHFITDSRRFGAAVPWPPRPVMVDQSLHLAQLALLSRVLTGGSGSYLLAGACVAGMCVLYTAYGLYERRLSKAPV